MSTVTIRNLSKATHRALKLRAAQHGRSTEAEMRAILEAAVRRPIGAGIELAAIGRSLGGIDLQLQRDATAVSAARLE